MDFELHKIPNIASFTYKSSYKKHLKNTHRHIDGFNSLIKYLVKLRRDGVLDDDVFEQLIKKAAAIFIEAEITERIDDVLEDKISTEYLLSMLR